jgi:hypothetical protein
MHKNKGNIPSTLTVAGTILLQCISPMFRGGTYFGEFLIFGTTKPTSSARGLFRLGTRNVSFRPTNRAGQLCSGYTAMI